MTEICRGERSPQRIRLRTCIASKERKPDSELLRVVVDPEDHARLIPDPARRLPGRGAWITPDLAALELAVQRRAFGRALRVSTTVDTGQVRAYLAAQAAGTDIIRKTEH
ncbi:YlxR family protein [Corynebacterium halotolerans]|uniref:YlxR family protein n=1 Tax=Corynebacterium halotolerans TaxID=225326 RepID=UPI003CECA258